MNKLISTALASTALAALAVTSEAHAQGTYFGGAYGEVNTFVAGAGGLYNNVYNGGTITDLYIELRATSGTAGSGSDNNGQVNWAYNDAFTIAVQGTDYGGGLNDPYITLSGWDDYGNWVTMWVTLGQWWPNDGGMHPLRFSLLQAGYGANSRKDINVSMDGVFVPSAKIYGDPGSVVHIPFYSGGNFNFGWGSRVGISRFSATEGVYPNPYTGPVLVGNGADSTEGGYPGDLTNNQGYGSNPLYFPDVSFEIYFDDGCPSC